jgi:hypothetical protein
MGCNPTRREVPGVQSPRHPRRNAHGCGSSCRSHTHDRPSPWLSGGFSLERSDPAVGMTPRRFLLLAAALYCLSVLFASCAERSPVAPDQTPGWLTALIHAFERDPVASPPLSITRYEYRAKSSTSYRSAAAISGARCIGRTEVCCATRTAASQGEATAAVRIF